MKKADKTNALISAGLKARKKVEAELKGVEIQEDAFPEALEAAKTKPGENRTPAHNPGKGQKSDFRSVTITLPPDMFATIANEAHRRKIAGEGNTTMSAVIRDLLADVVGTLKN